MVEFLNVAPKVEHPTDLVRNQIIWTDTPTHRFIKIENEMQKFMDGCGSTLVIHIDRDEENRQQIEQAMIDAAMIRDAVSKGQASLWWPGKDIRHAGCIPACFYYNNDGSNMTDDEIKWFLRRYPQFRTTGRI